MVSIFDSNPFYLSMGVRPWKISVIGAGYVGLVTGGCLAGLGHEVICTDSDAEKLKTLNLRKAADLRAGARLRDRGKHARQRLELSFRVHSGRNDSGERGDFYLCWHAAAP